MLSVDGDADAALGARIQIGWNKFRHLVPLLDKLTWLQLSIRMAATAAAFTDRI